MKRLAVALLAAGALVVALFQLAPWEDDTDIEIDTTTAAAGAAPAAGEDLGAMVNAGAGQHLVADDAGEESADGKREEISSARIRVSGRLAARDGDRVPRTKIHLHLGQAAVSSGPMMYYDPNRKIEPPDAVAHTDGEGRFSFAVPRRKGGRVSLAGGDLVWAKAAPRFLASESDLDLGELPVLPGAVLRGRIVSDTDAPIKAAKVRFINYEDAQSSRTTDSDDAGRFELRGLTAGHSYITVSCTGYTTCYMQVDVETGKTRENFVLRLRRGDTLLGVVVDDAGTPIAGAKVNVSGPGRSIPGGGYEYSSGSATADDKGEFRVSGLAAGPYRVQGAAQGHRADSVSTVKLEDGPLRLQLTRLGSLIGKLIDENGSPIAGSRVQATYRDPNAKKNPGSRGVMSSELVNAGYRGKPVARGAATDAAGGFTVEGIRPGRVWLVATGAHHRAVHGPLEIQPGARVDAVTVSAERGPVARVRVVDPVGEPVASARVALRKPGGKAARSPGERTHGFPVVANTNAKSRAIKTATTDAKGDCLIAGVEPGDYELSAAHERWVAAPPLTLKMPDQGQVEAEIRMAAGGTVAIHIVDHRGKPAAEQAFRIFAAQDASAPAKKQPAQASVRSGRADATGRATFGPLAPGRYEAALQLSGSPNTGMMMWGFGSQQHGAEIGQRVSFDVVAEEIAKVELRRPELAEVAGTVRDLSGPLGNALVVISPVPDQKNAGNWGLAAASTRRARTDEQGRYRLEGLAPGKFTLSVQRKKTELAFREDLELGVAGEHRKDLFLVASVVELTLKSDDGKPAADLLVTLSPKARGLFMTMTLDGSGRSASATSDEKGVARFDVIPPGAYSVRYAGKKFMQPAADVKVEVEKGATVKRELELIVAASLRIECEAAPGTGTMTMYHLETKLEGGDAKPKVRRMRGATHTMTGLLPGRYTVRARRHTDSRGNPPATWSAPLVVELQRGKTGMAKVIVP